MSVTQTKTVAAAALAITLLASGSGARAQRVIAPGDLPGDRAPARVFESPGNPERVEPRLEGLILQIDTSGRLAEFSVGPEKGVVAGQTIMVYRLTPSPRYIGKIVIVAAKPGRCLGIVVGQRTDQEIKKGDRIIEERPKAPSQQILPL